MVQSGGKTIIILYICQQLWGQKIDFYLTFLCCQEHVSCISYPSKLTKNLSSFIAGLYRRDVAKLWPVEKILKRFNREF